MKLDIPARRCAALALAAALLATASLPAIAAEPLPKEENLYATLDATGAVQAVYAVSHFDPAAGQTITDHGAYTEVRGMTTTDPVRYENGVVTITPAEAGPVYYQGTLADPSLPWLVSLDYTLDGQPIAPEALGGASGALEITLRVRRNPDCAGDFFDRYALQTTLTLDSARVQSLDAPGATIANVGSDKQLTYILLPGQESELVIRADVTDFAMSGVSLNGVKLSLDLGLDGVSLTDTLGELQTGSVQLDDGANALDAGIRQVQAGLDTLNAQSPALRGGSAQVRAALNQMQAALNGVSADASQLQTLLDASAQIQAGIGQLDDGAAQLEQQVSFEAYKAVLLENGLDLDLVQNGNAEAIRQLAGLRAFLPCCLREQLDNIVLLLRGSSAQIDAAQLYLDTVHEGLATLHAGSTALRENYALFDAGVRELGGALTGLLQNLAVLTSAVNTLANQYGQLDDGVGAYTGGVAQLTSGVRQLADGSAQLVAGTGTLRSGVAGAALGEGLDSLLASLSDDSAPVSFLSAENTAVTSVQFALQTAAIEPPAAPAEPEPEPVQLTFWQKLLRLFGLYRG